MVLTIPFYVTRKLRGRKISALIVFRQRIDYWSGKYTERNRAVANHLLSGNNAHRKWTTGYLCRLIAETTMYKVKQIFGGTLTPQNYDSQVAEVMVLGACAEQNNEGSNARKRAYFLTTAIVCRAAYPKFDLLNKAIKALK